MGSTSQMQVPMSMHAMADSGHMMNHDMPGSLDMHMQQHQLPHQMLPHLGMQNDNSGVLGMYSSLHADM